MSLFPTCKKIGKLEGFNGLILLLSSNIQKARMMEVCFFSTAHYTLTRAFLQRLNVIAQTGVSLADHQLELYNTKWQRSVDPLYRELMY